MRSQIQVISQDETPRLYSLVFGEGVVNDATSVVLFNAIKNLDITQLKGGVALKVISDFLYLFFTSTMLGVTVSKHLSDIRFFSITMLLLCFSQN